MESIQRGLGAANRNSQSVSIPTADEAQDDAVCRAPLPRDTHVVLATFAMASIRWWDLHGRIMDRDCNDEVPPDHSAVEAIAK